jgi:DNA end-binding protein Ku
MFVYVTDNGFEIDLERACRPAPTLSPHGTGSQSTALGITACMARPTWQGQIQISLVSFGVSIVPASTSARQVAFHEVDRKTGERIHHRKTAGGDEAVEAEDVAKGFEYEKGKYLVIEPEDLKRVRLPGQRTVTLEHFVPRNEIDPAYFERPYFLIPKDELQARTMATMSRALRESERVGLAEITFSGREHFVAIAPPTDADSPWLNMYLLRYEEELRDPAAYYGDLKKPSIDKKQLAMAEQLIESYSEAFEPAAFKDDFEAALREFVQAKLHNRKLPKPEAVPKPGKVIDLMDALKRSLAERKSGHAEHAAGEHAKAKTRRRKAA